MSALRHIARFTGRLLLGLLGLVLFVVLTVVAVAALAWYMPERWLTTANVEKHLLPRLPGWGVDIRPEGLVVGARSESFWDKSLQLRAARICWEKPGFTERLCVRDLDLDVLARLEPGTEEKFALVRKLHGFAEAFAILPGEEAPEVEAEKDAQTSETLFEVPAIVGKIDWTDVAVEAEGVSGGEGASRWLASAKVRSPSPSQLGVDGEFRAKDYGAKVAANFELEGFEGVKGTLRVRPTYPARLTREYGSELPQVFGLQAHATTKGDFSIKLDTVTTRILTLDLETSHRAGPGEKIRLRGEIRVPDFKKAARVADGFDVLIPAPIAALKGLIALKVEGDLDPDGPQGKLKLDLTTQLRSPGQALELLADGDIAFRKCLPHEEGSSVVVDLVSRKARLELPPIDFLKPPALAPDDRFRELPKEVAKKSPAKKIPCDRSLQFRFRTAPGAPIFLAGAIVKNAVPIQIDLQKTDDAAVEGFLRVEKFTTELFRRKGTVDRFNYDLRTGVLDGRAHVDYTDYRIGIALTGRADSIRVDFDSDPPLSRQGALSVLLFGRTIEGLDDDESGSVVNADAAAKNGALSLASLYLFASTPIESVGYNPQTQGVTAKVKLADGTSLNVGANERGVTDVGIRRRLSKEWRVETTVRNPNDPNARATQTLLEWFRRF